jgi:hypothetical protein
VLRDKWEAFRPTQLREREVRWRSGYNEALGYSKGRNNSAEDEVRDKRNKKVNKK